MKIYTVCGVYEDNGQRFCTAVEAESPEDAEALAQHEGGQSLLIAAVFEGNHTPVDVDPVFG